MIIFKAFEGFPNICKAFPSMPYSKKKKKKKKKKGSAYFIFFNMLFKTQIFFRSCISGPGISVQCYVIKWASKSNKITVGPVCKIHYIFGPQF